MSARPAEVLVVQGNRAGLDQLFCCEDVQAGAVVTEGGGGDAGRASAELQAGSLSI